MAEYRIRTKEETIKRQREIERKYDDLRTRHPELRLLDIHTGSIPLERILKLSAEDLTRHSRLRRLWHRYHSHLGGFYFP